MLQLLGHDDMKTDIWLARSKHGSDVQRAEAESLFWTTRTIYSTSILRCSGVMWRSDQQLYSVIPDAVRYQLQYCGLHAEHCSFVGSISRAQRWVVRCLDYSCPMDSRYRARLLRVLVAVLTFLAYTLYGEGGALRPFY